MAARKSTILRNVLNVVADEKSITSSEGGFGSIIRQLGYAGIHVSASELISALDGKVETCPTVFGQTPPYRKGYCTLGMEFRFDNPNYSKARNSIERVYEVTDTLDRTTNDRGYERIRPTAFAICLGNLRVRWARGNFSVPSKKTVEGWFNHHPEFTQTVREILSAA